MERDCTMEREAFQKDVFISMSHCAYDARMDISALATLCADLATEHAERLGIGTKLVREKGIFWMTARTQLRIHRAPALGEGVLARTWIESLRGAHSVRCYRLVQKEEIRQTSRGESGCSCHRWVPCGSSRDRQHRRRDRYSPAY
ncbi:MAG: hypothetical protein IJ074_02190, partial [Clostridia bacterium]|nr:hypothetical protein [Clostridia bacterium]